MVGSVGSLGSDVGLFGRGCFLSHVWVGGECPPTAAWVLKRKPGGPRRSRSVARLGLPPLDGLLTALTGRG